MFRHGNTAEDYGIVNGKWDPYTLSEAYHKMADRIGDKYQNMLIGKRVKFSDYEAAILLTAFLIDDNSRIDVPLKLQLQALKYFKSIDRKLSHALQPIIKYNRSIKSNENKSHPSDEGKLIDNKSNLLGGQIYVLHGAASRLNQMNFQHTPNKQTPIKLWPLVQTLKSLGLKQEAVFFLPDNKKDGLLAYALSNLRGFHSLARREIPEQKLSPEIRKRREENGYKVLPGEPITSLDWTDPHKKPRQGSPLSRFSGRLKSIAAAGKKLRELRPPNKGKTR